VRIVSYNVRYFGHGLKGLASTAASKRRIATALAALHPLPDLVALQEVETSSLRAGLAHRGSHPAETQLEAFLRHLSEDFKHRGKVMPYRAWYFPAHVYQLGPLKLYTTGLAMLVNCQKLEVIADNGHRPHPITHHRNESLKKVKQTRIAAHLRLEDLHGRRFHLFNTHLSLPTPWAKEFWSQPGKMGFGTNQLAEAKAVSEYAEATSKHEPYLVVGDFNTAPMTPVYRYLTHDAKLRGAQEQLKQLEPAGGIAGGSAFATAGFMHLRMHLDHLFASGEIGFTDLAGTHTFGDPTSPFSGLSDHVPLIAHFDVG
jgi:endonuclease/exonuclease/phosphatase family metal-dependent hydrolase